MKMSIETGTGELLKEQLCPPRIPHVFFRPRTRARTCTTAVTNRFLTTWIMAQQILKQKITFTVH